MTDSFHTAYASCYDLLYGDKDYNAECDAIETALRQAKIPNTASILDLGCGTGNHVIPLIQRGYEVTGVDLSPEMLAFAKRKLHAANLSAELIHSDMKDISLGRKFDVVLCMFAALCYQTTNAALVQTIRRVREHIKPGGIFMFDFWYGPAVLHIRPEARSKTIEKDGKRLIRSAAPSLDSRHQTSVTEYRLQLFEKDELVFDSVERHAVRYFFPLEISYVLENVGFSVLHFGQFPDYEKPLDDTTWNAMIIAGAV